MTRGFWERRISSYRTPRAAPTCLHEGAAVGRRVFLGGLAAASGALASSMLFPPIPAGAQAATALPLLSDLNGILPPTQMTTTCTTAGSLQVSWAPGSIPSGSIRCNVYVDNVLVATSWGINATVSGLGTTADHRIEVATLSADNRESERTAAVVRKAVVDVNPSPQPPYLVAIPAFGGAHLRWVHGGQGGSAKPAGYAILSPGSTTPRQVLPGDATSCFVKGLTPWTPVELILESRDQAGAPIARARNSVRVVPYARAVNSDRTAPSVPGGLVLTTGNGAVSATWRASTDAGGGVLGYKVFVDGKFRLRVDSGVTAVIGNLVNGRSFSVAVSAFDSNGNESARSAQASATPLSTRPGMTANNQPPTFGYVNQQIIDPSGRPFVPVGANVNGPSFIWLDDTRGHAVEAATNWRWNCIRLSTLVRDYSAGSGYIFHNNNKLDAIVDEYTARGIVIMLAQHSSFGGTGAGSSLPTAPGSAGDPSGRSSEVAATDWWVEVAKRYRDNPYVWFNLYNEPGPDTAGLDAQYRRMLARIRAVAPRSTIVLDAAAFANDIPTSTRIGTGTIAESDSYVLKYAAALDATYGVTGGYAPLVFSVHMYARWAVNWGGQGLVSDAQLANRIRDYVQRTRQKGVPLLIGEIGVEAYAYDADSQVVRVALYEQGTRTVGGVKTTTGVLVEQQIGVLAWHSARASGMNVASPAMNWWAADSREDTNQRPHTGAALWDYIHIA